MSLHTDEPTLEALHELNWPGYQRQLVGATYYRDEVLRSDEPVVWPVIEFSTEHALVVTHFGLSWKRGIGQPLIVCGTCSPHMVLLGEMTMVMTSFAVDVELLGGLRL